MLLQERNKRADIEIKTEIEKWIITKSLIKNWRNGVTKKDSWKRYRNGKQVIQRSNKYNINII